MFKLFGLSFVVIIKFYDFKTLFDFKFTAQELSFWIWDRQ